MCASERAGIDLDGEFAALGTIDAEVSSQVLEQSRQLRHRQIGGRAAAEVHLTHSPAPLEQRALQLDLTTQALQVLLGVRRVSGDDFVTAAIETRPRTERHVHIDRQRSRRAGVAQQRHAPVTLLVEAGVKLNRRRIGRVARSVAVVTTNQCSVEFHSRPCPVRVRSAGRWTSQRPTDRSATLPIRTPFTLASVSMSIQRASTLANQSEPSFTSRPACAASPHGGIELQLGAGRARRWSSHRRTRCSSHPRRHKGRQAPFGLK